MKLNYQSYQLELKYPFTISGFSRTATPLILLEIHYEGLTGLGEASMVPYMGENMETAALFLSKVDLFRLNYPFDFEEIINYLDTVAPGNPAVKAAIDIALHDLKGKIENKPCFTFFGSRPENMPLTSQTIGIDTPEMVRKKVREAEECKIIKVKVGSEQDKELVEVIRSVTDKPLFADANQGWKDLGMAKEMTHWLYEKGVVLIEQPMPKEDPDGNAGVTEQSPVPIIGDEAVQRLADVEKAKGVYHGINVKLMKSAGMHEAFNMIQKARELDMKILVGCMSETSIATMAGAALAPLCDWADLDGPFLTTNNPFKKPAFKDGRYVLSNSPGLGVEV